MKLHPKDKVMPYDHTFFLFELMFLQLVKIFLGTPTRDLLQKPFLPFMW